MPGDDIEKGKEEAILKVLRNFSESFKRVLGELNSDSLKKLQNPSIMMKISEIVRHVVLNLDQVFSSADACNKVFVFNSSKVELPVFHDDECLKLIEPFSEMRDASKSVVEGLFQRKKKDLRSNSKSIRCEFEKHVETAAEGKGGEGICKSRRTSDADGTCSVAEEYEPICGINGNVDGGADLSVENILEKESCVVAKTNESSAPCGRKRSYGRRSSVAGFDCVKPMVENTVQSVKKSIQCKHCEERFARRYQLRVHLSRGKCLERPEQCAGKTQSTRGESCRVCGKRMIKDQHQCEKAHQCDICGKRFCYAYLLKVHSRVHSSERIFQCETCGKQFRMLPSLYEHRKIHSGSKPYHCSQCGKSFGAAGTLKVHLRTHTGEKPYDCDICSKKFARSSHLVRHLAMHRGEKPHACDLCNFRCTQRSDLKRHQQRHLHHIGLTSETGCENGLATVEEQHSSSTSFDIPDAISEAATGVMFMEELSLGVSDVDHL